MWLFCLIYVYGKFWSAPSPSSYPILSNLNKYLSQSCLTLLTKLCSPQSPSFLYSAPMFDLSCLKSAKNDYLCLLCSLASCVLLLSPLHRYAHCHTILSEQILKVLILFQCSDAHVRLFLFTFPFNVPLLVCSLCICSPVSFILSHFPKPSFWLDSPCYKFVQTFP